MNTQAPIKQRKKKGKPFTPAMPTEWDKGAEGRANRIGLVEEPAVEIDPKTGKPEANPNNVKRMRRVDMLEVYHRKGVISTRGFNAAEKLRDAFESTMRGPGWQDNERVQSSPKPDHAVAVQIDRISRFHAIAKLVPQNDLPIIDACVFQMNSPTSAVFNGLKIYRGTGAGYDRGMKHLQDALDRLADAMG